MELAPLPRYVQLQHCKRHMHGKEKKKTGASSNSTPEPPLPRVIVIPGHIRHRHLSGTLSTRTYRQLHSYILNLKIDTGHVYVRNIPFVTHILTVLIPAAM